MTTQINLYLLVTETDSREVRAYNQSEAAETYNRERLNQPGADGPRLVEIHYIGKVETDAERIAEKSFTSAELAEWDVDPAIER